MKWVQLDWEDENGNSVQPIIREVRLPSDFSRFSEVSIRGARWFDQQGKEWESVSTGVCGGEELPGRITLRIVGEAVKTEQAEAAEGG